MAAAAAVAARVGGSFTGLRRKEEHAQQPAVVAAAAKQHRRHVRCHMRDVSPPRAVAVSAPPLLEPTTTAEPSFTEDASVTGRVPKVYKTEEGFWQLKPTELKGINPAEKIKLKKEGMKMLEDIVSLSTKSMEEIDADKDLKDDIDVRLKWLGLFHRRKRQYGRFMMRLKLPNGICTSEQVRFLASVISKYGEEGCADVTTRQNWQIRGVTLADVTWVLDGLERVGLTSIQSGMDNVRNCVGSPLAGIDPHEIIDTRPYNKLISDWVVRNNAMNPEITNLPRKWNVAIVGTHDEFEHPHINDLAFVPAIKEGVFGFNVLVGGFFSPVRCEMAIPMDAWVPASEVINMVSAQLTVFRDFGFRGNRQKCRIMYLVEEMGVEGFRAEVEARMKGGVLQREGESMLDHGWERRTYLGVHKQKQEGLSWCGMLVPVGRMQAEEMVELARLADTLILVLRLIPCAQIRLTVEQNVIIPNIPDSKLSSLLSEPFLHKFTPSPGPLQSGLVACTGSQFCGQAIIETKSRAQVVTEELETTMNLPRPVRMHWTGCPNTCGQVQVADIGFLGSMARDADGKPCEGADIYLGGKVGAESTLGTCVRSKVPHYEIVKVTQELLVEHFGATYKS
eukprot:jgi/Chlat1/3373/Chrsp23S00271